MKLHQGCDFKTQEHKSQETQNSEKKKKTNQTQKRRGKIYNKLCPNPVLSHLQHSYYVQTQFTQ